ncbi:MAG: ATP/GTP-binding protein [Frankiales bacterium]|nr:ATP/GTP-binding protein [Frankiales bacterium]
MTRPLPSVRIGGRLADSIAVTTRHSASLYPWQIGSALPTGPSAGPVIGLDVLAGRTVFHYDPWELYARHIITSPNMVVLGQLGKGKSALVKTHLHRQLLAGRQVFVLDPKGEYRALAQLHGIPHLRLAPGSSDRLNPLDPHPGDNPAATQRRRATTVAALAATGLGRDLTPEERAAVTAALTDLPPAALLGDVVHLLLNPTDAMADVLSTGVERLAGAVRPVALELRRLLDGDLSGLVDAPTSCHLDPDGPGLVLDLSAAFGTPALVAVMVCAGSWLAATLTQQPSHHQAGSFLGSGPSAASGSRQRLLLVDEAWALLHLPAATAWLQALSKLARAHGIQLITVVHRASDLAGQADTGTATQAQARGLLADAETRVLYTQAAGERALLSDLLDLTGPELELVTQLPPHRALWRIGTHAAVVDHLLSPLEAQRLVDTDASMRRRHTNRAGGQGSGS